MGVFSSISNGFQNSLPNNPNQPERASSGITSSGDRITGSAFCYRNDVTAIITFYDSVQSHLPAPYKHIRRLANHQHPSENDDNRNAGK